MLVVLEPCLAVRRQAIQCTFDKASFLIFYAEYNKNTSLGQSSSWFFLTPSSIEREAAQERGGVASALVLGRVSSMVALLPKGRSGCSPF